MNEFKRNKLYRGDVLDVLADWPDECVNTIITSPPYYGLRIYLDKEHPDKDKEIGLEESFEQFLARMLEITAELKRVLKPTGQFWLNIGDCFGGSGIGTNDYRTEASRSINKSSEMHPDKSRLLNCPAKCMLMQPERLAIAMIDRQGWILRNKVKWAKQVMIKKKRKTIGSVMPTSAKDRFNESGDELYFFVKQKKYWSDLDAVRLPHQTIDNRPSGMIRQRLYKNSKYNQARKQGNVDGSFNYRVRDAKKKSKQCPQFKATEEEIKAYQGKFAGKKDHEKYNSPRARTQRKRNKDQSKKEKYDTNPKGKNLPSIWQINPEPHNFEKELNLDVEHFAAFPQELVEIPIKFGCPREICKKCGKARARITESTKEYKKELGKSWHNHKKDKKQGAGQKGKRLDSAEYQTIGWTKCDCKDPKYQPGIVLDPFCGSGTSLIVAKKLRRDWVGIDINEEYLKIAKKRLKSKPKPML